MSFDNIFDLTVGVYLHFCNKRNVSDDSSGGGNTVIAPPYSVFVCILQRMGTNKAT